MALPADSFAKAVTPPVAPSIGKMLHDTLDATALPLATVAVCDLAMAVLVAQCQPSGCLSDGVMVSALVTGAAVTLAALVIPAAVTMQRARAKFRQETAEHRKALAALALATEPATH